MLPCKFIIFNISTTFATIKKTPQNQIQIVKIGFTIFMSSSWCYKTFFGGILENLDFPQS